MSTAKQDNDGLWYYDSLPEGSRPVTETDWENKTQALCNNTPLAVQGADGKVYYFSRIISVARDGLHQFISAGRAWIIPEGSCPPDTGNTIPETCTVSPDVEKKIAQAIITKEFERVLPDNQRRLEL